MKTDHHQATAHPREALLSFQQIGVSFPLAAGWLQRSRHVHAVSDVSFDLYPGEVLGIVGESGSGKSTMARMAVGLLQPTSGRILYRGKPLSTYRGEARRRLGSEIQMVFQDPNASLNPRLTIEQSLREPFVLHQLGSAIEQHEEIVLLLAVVGLPISVLHRYPHELSGGQKQRVVIARALALKPKVLIADEAVAALDASVKAQIVNLLLDLQKNLGLSIIFISHDLPLVQAVCDRVLVLYLGRLMESAEGPVIAGGGSHPYTRALWQSSPVADPDQRLTADDGLQGEIPSPLDPPAGCVFHPRCPQAETICRQHRPPARRPSERQTVCCHLAPDSDPQLNP